MKKRSCVIFRSGLAALIGTLVIALNTLLPDRASAAVALPQITGFTPAGGAPGNSVVIMGVNFINVKEVRFGNAFAIYNVDSPGQITATVPLDAMSGAISMTTGSGSAYSRTEFTVAPRITGFSPTNGAPNTAVVIQGANFIPGSTIVKFNGTNATSVSVVASTQINAVVPLKATSGPISVSTFIGTALVGTAVSTNNFVITGSEPAISDFSPTNGPVGTVVIINGRNFNGTTAVKFNGTNASFSVNAPTQIQTTAPAGATTGPITVTTASGTASSPKSFIVSSAPFVTGFSPANGKAGTLVVIDGFNFTGATVVKFNTNAANFAVTAPTQITAAVPIGATTGPITVITPKGTNVTATSFVVTLEPIITDFSPDSGPPGTIVTINGQNFLGTTNVFFGTNASAFSVVSPTQINAFAPLSSGSVLISVAGPNGAVTNATSFLITTGAPIIKSFAPMAGPPGTQVIIDGINFSGCTNVKFGALDAPFAVTSPTQITCTAPSNAITGLITVATLFGTNTSTNPFIVSPRITSFSPTNGIAGIPVTIRGTNFTDVIAVKFNGGIAQFTNDSPGQITAIVPPDAVPGNISVTTPGGIVASTNAFIPLPNLIRFSPAAGPPGTIITITGTHLGDATLVQFGGAAASFSVVSSTELLASVPFGAGAAPIVVRTPEGVTASTNNFVAVDSAALTVSVQTPADLLPLGSNITYTVTVTNAGPSTASNLILTNLFPASALFVSAFVSRGSFDQHGALTVCRFGNVPSGTNVVLSLTVTPTAAGVLTNLTQAKASEFDPDLTDNTATKVATMVPGPTTIRAELDSGQVVIAWPTAATNYVLEATSGFTGGTWTVVTNNPVVIGAEKQVILPPAASSQFFRLHKH